MEINADFSKRVVIHTPDIPWQDSPMKGVRRRMLDRVGGEVARATSIVSYDPGSKFSPHVHTGGEEFIVLDGVFQDEHGDFPAGSYLRNPPGSRHTPGSELGCVIFVKLWQFHLEDRAYVRSDTNKVLMQEDEERSGVTVSRLFVDERESVRLEQWAPHSRVELDSREGAEIFVLEGSFNEGGRQLRQHSWMRLPVGSNFVGEVSAEGAKVWVKTRHLRYAQNEVAQLPA